MDNSWTSMACNAGAARTWREAAGAGGAPWPVVISEKGGQAAGTALVVHGRNGAPDQSQIVEIAQAYLARGWRVAAPELPYSSALPESGPPGELTLDRHRRAAADVYLWAASRWADAPLALAGHSIGAYAAARLAAEAEGLHHLLAVSPVISGRALLDARIAMGPKAVEALEREVPLLRAEMEAEDAAPALASLSAPVAVVSGELDGLVPLHAARAYFDAAPRGHFFGALPGEHHCPAGPAAAQMLAAALVAVGA